MLATIKTDEFEVPRMIMGISIDKIVHFILFFPYPILLWLAYGKHINLHFRSLIFWVIVISGYAVALLIESFQLLNPNRSFEPGDILANIIAITSGSIIVALYIRSKNSKKK
jgi:VanZ family protein